MNDLYYFIIVFFLWPIIVMLIDIEMSLRKENRKLKLENKELRRVFKEPLKIVHDLEMKITELDEVMDMLTGGYVVRY